MFFRDVTTLSNLLGAFYQVRDDLISLTDDSVSNPSKSDCFYANGGIILPPHTSGISTFTILLHLCLGMLVWVRKYSVGKDAGRVWRNQSVGKDAGCGWRKYGVGGDA